MWRELAATVAHAQAATALLLLRIFHYCGDAGEIDNSYEDEEFLTDFLTTAAEKPFTRIEASQLVEFCEAERLFAHGAILFVDQILKGDPKDPLFRLYQYLLRPFSLDYSDGRAELEAISEEAIRRGDHKTAQLARQYLARTKPPSVPRFPMEDEINIEEPDVEPDFAPDVWVPEDADHPDSFPIPALGDMSALQPLFALLANASNAEIRRFRRTLPKEIPLKLFDAMVAAARSGLPLPSFPPSPAGPAPEIAPAAARPAPPKKDPNQMEFF